MTDLFITISVPMFAVAAIAICHALCWIANVLTRIADLLENTAPGGVLDVKVR